MTLGASIAAALPGFRAEAESLMVDLCTITVPGEPDPDAEIDEDTGIVPPPEPQTIYGPEVEPHFGMCQLQANNVQPGNSTAGETEYTTFAYVVKLPTSAPDVPNGATVDLDSVTLTVTESVYKTFQKSRPLLCEEVS